MLRGTVRAKERKRKSREVGEVAVLLLTGLTAAGSRAYISSRSSCRLEGTSRGKVITACPVPAHSPTHTALSLRLRLSLRLSLTPTGELPLSSTAFPFSLFTPLSPLLSSLPLSPLLSPSSPPPLPPFSPHLISSSSSSPHPPPLLSPLSFTMHLASTYMYLYSLSVVRHFINTYGLRIDGGKYSSYSLQVPSNAFPPRVSKPQASSWLLSANTGTSVPLTS